MDPLEGDRMPGLTPARWALYAALASSLVWLPGVPFLWTFPGAVWARVAVAAAAVCAAWAVLRGGAALRCPSDPFAGALAGALAVALVSAALGVAPLRSLFGNLERMGGVVGLVHLAAWYLLLRTVLDDGGWRRMLGALALVAGAAGLAATVQWVAGGGPPFRAYAPLGNSGPLGGLLATGVFAAAASAAGPEAGRRWRWTVGAAGGLALVGLAASGTRAAGGGLVLGAAVGGVAWLLRSRGIDARRLAPWAAGAAVVGAAALVGIAAGAGEEASPSGPSAVEATSLAELRADRTLGMRLDAWAAAAEGAAERPLAGWGPENFRIVFDRHGAVVRSERVTQALSYDRAHDFFAEAAATGGLPGLLAALLVAFAALWTALGAALDPSATGPVEGGALAAGVVAHGGYLLFWFQDPAVAPAALVLIGLAAHRREGRRWLGSDSGGGSAGTPGRAAGAVAVLAALAVAVHAVLLVPPARTAERAGLASDARTKFRLFDRAARSRVPGAEEVVARYAGTVSSLLPRARVLARDPGAESTLDAAFASVRRALSRQIERDPENGQLRALLSRVLLTEARWRGDRGLAEEAVDAMAEAVSRAPAHLVYRYALSEMLRVTERSEASVEVLRRALEAGPTVDATRVHLARAFTRAGQPDSAAAYLLEGRSAVRTPADTVLMRRLLSELADEQGGARVRGLQDLLAETRRTLRAGGTGN